MADAGGAWDNAKKVVEVDLHAKGTALHDATIVGGARRLRPILMTALAAIFVLWCVAAWAQNRITFGDDLAAIPPLALVLVAVLSVLGGLTSTLRKMHDRSEAVRSFGLLIAKDVLSSLSAGMLTFFITESYNVDSLLQAVAIYAAGFSSARVLNALSQDWLPLILRQDRRGPDADPPGSERRRPRKPKPQDDEP